MNYSIPLAFQAQFGSQTNPFAAPNSFPQINNPRLASMLYSMENFAQNPEMMSRQKITPNEDTNENFMYEPMKKMKTANCAEFGLLNNQGNLLNQIQINDQIKNKGITSSYNPMFLAGSNHPFDQRFGANQAQEPQLNNRSFGYDLSELNPYQAQAPQSYLDQAKMMYQMQYNNASMMRDQSGRPVQMSSNNLMRAQQNSLASQMSILQNLEQQIAQSQKALEQLHAKTQNQIYNNAPNFNLVNYQRERQFMMDQQQSQDFRALFEQGAHKVFGDFSFLKKNENPKIDEVAPQNFQNSEFLDLSFDPNMFVDSFNFEENAFERPKSRPADDLDEKRTAETSACNPDEILFSQMAELLPEAGLFGGSETTKKVSPSKKDDSLLKKRKLDFVENEEKSISEAANKVKRGRPSSQNKAASTVQQFQTETELSPSYDKPKSGSIKVRKDKNSPKIADYLPVAPAKRERRMNRLQSMRAAWENYFEEQKKPYTIKLHVDPSDEEYSKLVETRRGESYQAEIRPIESDSQSSRRRSIKTMWDPSTIESSKIQEFYSRLTEIYREEPRNEEAALMILRGTGMDVGSAIELIKNNCDYFRERLFTEPKPLKAQRAL